MKKRLTYTPQHILKTLINDVMVDFNEVLIRTNKLTYPYIIDALEALDLPYKIDNDHKYDIIIPKQNFIKCCEDLYHIYKERYLARFNF